MGSTSFIGNVVWIWRKTSSESAVRKTTTHFHPVTVDVKNAACGTFFYKLLDVKYQWMSQSHLTVISFLSLDTIYSCFCLFFFFFFSLNKTPEINFKADMFFSLQTVLNFWRERTLPGIISQATHVHLKWTLRSLTLMGFFFFFSRVAYM